MLELPPPPNIDLSSETINGEEFKEDSVREEIIHPILRSLGYNANKPNQIVRSRSLIHPFVYIGSVKKNIFIIPDYTIEINSKPSFILDAKSPKEDILRGKNVEQAYSYAIHTDIRCELYVLCNGNLLSIFSIHEYKPKYVFSINNLTQHWKELYSVLSPIAIAKPHTVNFVPDLGLAMRKSGVGHTEEIHFLGFPVDHIHKVDDNTFTTSKNAPMMGKEYIVSLDFDWRTLYSLLVNLPKDVQKSIFLPLTRQPYVSDFSSHMFFINITVCLSENIEENEDESYIPFKVIKAELSPDYTNFITRNGVENPGNL